MASDTSGDLLKHKTGLNADEIEALAEYAGVGLLKMDISTGEINLNRVIAQLAGYEPGEVPHTEDTKKILTFTEDWERVSRCMEAVMSGESDRYHLEYRMCRKDGSIASVSENMIVCERDEDGNPIGLAGLALDLSRLRWAEEKARNMEREAKRLTQNTSESKLAEQNRLLRAAIDAAVIIVGGVHQSYETVLRQSLQVLAESIQADHACIWKNINRSGKLYCFSRVQWAEEGDAQSIDKNELLDYDNILPDWKKKLMQDAGLCMLARDFPADFRLPGAEQFKTIMLLPIYLEGKFWGMMGVGSQIRDTLFTGDEAEITALGAEVIAASLARNEAFMSLSEAREEAMASMRAKEEFLSRMSHEIRTPMNAIIGMTALAQKAKGFDRIHYCLDKVENSSRQLLSLINDVLDMSKIDSGKLEIVKDEFDFEQMMQYVFNIIQVKLEEKHQNFIVDFSSVFTRTVISDELRLSQIMINLLTNAIKFTSHGGEIALHIFEQPLDKKRSRLRIEVSDNGIGIAPEQQTRLFQAFEQADGGITREYGGTGLGLAICKKIVNLLGGNIWVKSTLGQGSSFFFEIEVEWGKRLFSVSSLRAEHRKLRFLVVDDDRDTRNHLTSVLESFALDWDTAENGKEAIEAVENSLHSQKTYDMMLIDWSLPDTDCGKTIAEIRRLMNGKDIAVVIISASDWYIIENEAKEHGISNYLTKPVIPSTLYNTIIKLCKNSLVPESAGECEQIREWSGQTILLAEDMEINREIVQGILEDTGIEIVCACDGEEAIQMFSHSPEQFDLILMDIQMPYVDGFQATSMIREMAHPRAAQIPILAMTANAFKEDAQLCLDAGMNDHIAKPIDIETLFQKLSVYLNGGKQTEQEENGRVEDENEEYLDITEGLGRVRGNAPLYKKLLNRYLEDTWLDKLQCALAKGDSAAAQGIAHAIKGTSSNLSLKMLYKKVTELDAALKGGKNVHVLDDIISCAEKTNQLIRQQMNQF